MRISGLVQLQVPSHPGIPSLIVICIPNFEAVVTQPELGSFTLAAANIRQRFDVAAEI